MVVMMMVMVVVADPGVEVVADLVESGHGFDSDALIVILRVAPVIYIKISK